MKAWEILKALDEGKSVQRCVLTTGHDKSWVDVNPEHVKNWLVCCVDLYPVRIKPEPRKVWVIENTNGHMMTYTNIDHLDPNSSYLKAIHGPFELKD